MKNDRRIPEWGGERGARETSELRFVLRLSPQSIRLLISPPAAGRQVSTPSHGRRRAVDLQITGPSLRGSPGRSGGGGHNGVAYYDPKGAITSTTTYASPSIAPSTLFRG